MRQIDTDSRNEVLPSERTSHLVQRHGYDISPLRSLQSGVSSDVSSMASVMNNERYTSTNGTVRNDDEKYKQILSSR